MLSPVHNPIEKSLYFGLERGKIHLLSEPQQAERAKKLLNQLEHRTLLRHLNLHDEGPIAAHLMHPSKGLGWTHEQTTSAIMRYMMFLLLSYLHPQITLVPTWEIDQVWHNHILHNTAKYVEDCKMWFGGVVNHCYDPSKLWGSTGRENPDVTFAQTQALFEQYFGNRVLEDARWNQTEREVAERQLACGRPKPKNA
jgi:hypothetical protein